MRVGTLLLYASLGAVFILMSCNGNRLMNEDGGEDHAFTNRLADESSPYLRQHAHNPVNWYPWSDEALEKAKAENKIILISVGYSSCHWCHVMEHESFEDTAVAAIMNEHFISIKVDREERPDIDDIYMTACHLSTQGSCGWPLNAFALPDGRPFWAGTYFPKETWLGILEQFKGLYQEDPGRLEKAATQITNGIQSTDVVDFEAPISAFSKDNLKEITNQFLDNIDFKFGGRDSEIKFPMPNNYEYLLKYNYYFQDERALEAVVATLDNMANGGIYDHAAGGFARYSTDQIWKVPHFEKMMYDNGQLISLYAQGYQQTKNPLYKKVVEETIAFINRKMTALNGAFYSSLDADSEGVEGKFYVWTKGELNQIWASKFDESLIEDLMKYYNVTEKGNWEHNNILYPGKNKRPASLTDENLQGAMKLVRINREKRIAPGLDNKSLVSWNALIMKGLCDAYVALEDEKYLKMALNNATFIQAKMINKDGRLNRNYMQKESVINAFLDDYALLIDAYVALYQITFDEKWLNVSNQMMEYVQTNFANEKAGMFYYTSQNDKGLIARKMELSDNVIPASNSVMAKNLIYLGHYLYKPEYVEQSKRMLSNMLKDISESKQPNFYSNWLQVYLLLMEEPYEIAVVGENWREIKMEMQRKYLPNALFLGGEDEGELALLQDKLVPNTTMIYVCRNKVCKLPVETASEAVNLVN